MHIEGILVVFVAMRNLQKAHIVIIHVMMYAHVMSTKQLMVQEGYIIDAEDIFTGNEKTRIYSRI